MHAKMLLFLLLPSLTLAGNFEFESRGGTSFLYYLTQENRYSQLPPGYRFDFSLDNQFYRFSHGHAFLNLANSTVISRHDTSLVQLDKIRYKLEPGYRHTWARSEASISLSHECLHNIDRERQNGSVFWNTTQLNWGTHGAFERNLISRVVQRDFQLRNSWDFLLNLDVFFFGDALYWIDQNHNYRGHASTLVRYNWALLQNMAFYADLRHESWINANAEWEHKDKIQLNWILVSKKSIGMVFLEYTILDQNPYDNEHSLWGLGFRILH